MTEFQKFSKIFKNCAKNIFKDLHFSIKTIDSNEIGIFLNNEGFVIEKTKYENSIKIYLRKNGKSDLLLRSFMIIYGCEMEKKCFEKGFNKLYFDTDEDLNGLLIFLRAQYDKILKKYFENDLMSREIENFFEKIPKKDFSLQETQQLLVESMTYSRRIRFSDRGEIYLLKELDNQ
ncbi:MAG: hypothetical protein J6J11_00835 [Treponema sp.]|nr:hypothetical protein [Treponema sp.]